MVADTMAATSSLPGQREPLPMGTEEMVRHLANSIANLTEQVQNMHERLDRQDRGDEQARPTHPPTVTRGTSSLARGVPRSCSFTARGPAGAAWPISPTPAT